MRAPNRPLLVSFDVDPETGELLVQFVDSALRDERRVKTASNAAAEVRSKLESFYGLKSAVDPLAACKRAAPWLGKLIAEGVHQQSVAPNDAVRTLQMVEAAIAANA